MTCAYCDKPFGEAPGDRSSRDHIIPKCMGVPGGRHGMVDACVDCNRLKAHHTPASLRAFAKDLEASAARHRTMADRVEVLMAERGLSL